METPAKRRKMNIETLRKRRENVDGKTMTNKEKCMYRNTKKRPKKIYVETLRQTRKKNYTKTLRKKRKKVQRNTETNRNNNKKKEKVDRKIRQQGKQFIIRNTLKKKEKS